MSPKKSPFFELRSGTVDTLLFVVKTTDLDAMRAELTRRFEATPEFFANDVVAIDVRRLAENERVPLAEIAQLLDSVRMRPVGVVANPQQGWAAESALPLLEARDRRGAGAKAAAEEDAQGAPGAESAADVESTGPVQGELPMDVPATAVEVVAGGPAAGGPGGAGGGGVGAAPAARAQAGAAGEGAKLVPSSQPTVVDKPLRSGQRIYAKGDLVVLG